MPIELTTKTGALAEVEWEVIKEHPTEGLLALLEMAAAGELPLPRRAARLRAPHEDRPERLSALASARATPTLFSRIVAIADGFDAGTQQAELPERTPGRPTRCSARCGTTRRAASIRCS